MKRFLRAVLWVLLIFIVPVGCALVSHNTNDERAKDWQTARRDSAGIAPDPATTSEAIIQVYAARAFRWRGALGVHTWIAVKPQNQDYFTRLEVIGFNVVRGRGGDAVRVARGVADGYWYGSYPLLLRDIRGGSEVDHLIEQLYQAAEEYPHKGEYRLWPGPNSNTFIAYLGREVPELRLNLPSTAIGKDYLPEGRFVATAPSGTGVQVSMSGLLGLIAAPEEGLEVNLLGLSAGIEYWPIAIKLPGVGRLAMPVEAVL